MTTKYRLPEELCGADYEPHAIRADADEADFEIPGIGWVTVPLSALTEVKPALPEEPPPGSVVETIVDGAHRVYLRDDEGLAISPRDWWPAGAGVPTTWAAICEIGTPVRLVPDPLEPVELPWTDEVFSVRLGTTTPLAIELSRSGTRWRMTAAAARGLARALWAAVDAAEAKP